MIILSDKGKINIYRIISEKTLNDIGAEYKFSIKKPFFADVYSLNISKNKNLYYVKQESVGG